MSEPAEPQSAPLSLPFRVTQLSPKKPTRFDLVPDAAARDRLAAALGISAVEAMSFKGELRPAGRHDVILEAALAARVVQPCSVTLVPVRTALAETVSRRFVADLPPPTGDEIEMPEDDSVEALPDVIDVGAIATEALALALPLYPRAPGAELGQAVFAAPGTAPLTDADLKPFSGLATLKDRLAGKGDGDA